MLKERFEGFSTAYSLNGPVSPDPERRHASCLVLHYSSDWTSHKWNAAKQSKGPPGYCLQYMGEAKEGCGLGDGIG